MLQTPTSTSEAVVQALPFTVEQLADPWWRISNLYTYTEKEGGPAKPFRPNADQSEMYRRLWYLNSVLKARQIGSTTFWLIMALDLCLHSKNFAVGIVAQGLTEGISLFRSKVRAVYDRLPEAMRNGITLVTENKRELVFGNGSSMTIGTSLRGGTLQMLIITEFGKIAAKAPAHAREIITGAMNTIATGQIIVVESTSEGAGGAFFELIQQSRELAQKKTPLTPLDFRFHFFPWWRRPEYTIDPSEVLITPTERRYFEQLENTVTTSPGVYLHLTEGQKAWYVKKSQTQKGDMKREFPATPDEAFEVAVEGAYYSKELALIRSRGQVGRFPWIPGYAVNTFWDLGGSAGNATSIWFHQRVNRRDRMVGYYEAEGEGMAHFVKYLQDCGYMYGKHYLPHDGAAQMQGDYRESRMEILERMGLRNVEIVPRVRDIGTGIELTRAMLPLLDFDEEECDAGLKALAAYTKTWNQTRAVWNEEPFHNWASNPADALRQMAQVYQDLSRGETLISVKNYTDDVYQAESKKRARANRPGWRSA